MSVAAKVIGKKSRSTFTKVIQTREVERRQDVRRIMCERVYVEACIIGEDSDKTDDVRLFFGFITDVSSRGLGLIVEVERGLRLPVHQKFQIRVFGRTFDGVVEATLAWTNPLPTLGGIIKIRDGDDLATEQVVPMRCGFSVKIDNNGSADFMRQLLSMAMD